MRVLVVRAFNDKYTDELYPIGKELTVSNDRGLELVKAEVVEVIPEPAKPKRTKKA